MLSVINHIWNVFIWQAHNIIRRFEYAANMKEMVGFG